MSTGAYKEKGSATQQPPQTLKSLKIIKNICYTAYTLKMVLSPTPQPTSTPSQLALLVASQQDGEIFGRTYLFAACVVNEFLFFSS
jgi:hypothetical protein